MVDDNLVERDGKCRVKPPRFVFLLIRIDVPFPKTFGQTLQNSVFATVIAAFAFVEETHDIQSRPDACFVAAIEAGIEDTTKYRRIWTSIEPVISIGNRRHSSRTWHDLFWIRFVKLSHL